MTLAAHPLMRLVGTFPPSSDQRRIAERLATTLSETLALLKHLEPGDGLAADALGCAAKTLSDITQTFGSVHGWTRAQGATIASEADRLLPSGHEFRPPSWIEG